MHLVLVQSFRYRNHMSSIQASRGQATATVDDFIEIAVLLLVRASRGDREAESVERSLGRILTLHLHFPMSSVSDLWADRMRTALDMASPAIVRLLASTASSDEALEMVHSAACLTTLWGPDERARNTEAETASVWFDQTVMLRNHMSMLASRSVTLVSTTAQQTISKRLH